MLEVFPEGSPFVAKDNRRTRPRLPTNACTLTRRHTLLMPRQVVRDASVLDLGCCIGATGHWTMTMGAVRYLGVEHQSGYVALARQLLSAWPRAKVVADDASRYAARGRVDFDVVALLGVAHGLFDPLALIRDAASRARRYLCFEDFGVRKSAAELTPAPWVPMPIAGKRASSVGFGWSVGPKAMQAIMRFLGFAPDMRPVFIAANRWLCRYVRTGAAGRSSSYSEQWVRWTR